MTDQGEKEESVAEGIIRRQIEDLVKAIRAKDIDGVTSFYAPDLVSFDLTPPLRHCGANGKRRAWEEAFAALSGPIAYEVRDPSVTINGGLGSFTASTTSTPRSLAVPSTRGCAGRRASGKSRASG